MRTHRDIVTIVLARKEREEILRHNDIGNFLLLVAIILLVLAFIGVRIFGE